jgi:hypothetical protein
MLAEDCGDGFIHVGCGNSGRGHPPNLVERDCNHAPRLAHQSDFTRALEPDDRGPITALLAFPQRLRPSRQTRKERRER